MESSQLKTCIAKSLEDAIRSKYCYGEIKNANELGETALNYRPGAVAVQKVQTIVLEGQGVSHISNGSDLSELCPEVKELHLCNNSLGQWQDVKSVLTASQKLTFLDLSHNQLISLDPAYPPPPLSMSLQILALNSTYISWSAVQNCLEACPSLQELHLGNNGYCSVDLDSSYSHISLKKLHINDNSISHWQEFEKLGHAFPTLNNLVAISNPLTEIAAVGKVFQSLQSLTLSSSNLKDWSSVESLSTLPDLSDLRLCNIPLGQDLSDEQRRYSIIARMPKLCWLNKSEITQTERDNAERWFIRRYRDDSVLPKIYQSLIDTHGDLKPLMNISLSPTHQMTLRFFIDHVNWNRTEVEKVDVRQTVGDLKHTWSKRLKVPIANLRLFYVEGVEDFTTELRVNTRPLQSYNMMKDGDCIHIQLL